MIPEKAADLEHANVQELTGFLQAEDPKLRADSACALGDRLRLKQIDSLPGTALNTLVAMLDEKAAFVRLEAAITLAELKERQATRTLLALTKKAKFRLDAIHALGIMGDPSAIESLQSILGGFLMPWADRLQAAAALCRLGDSFGAKYLEQRMNAIRNAERAAAIHFIGESSHPRALDILTTIIRDAKHPHRDVAIRAISFLSDSKRAIAVLKESIAELDGDMLEDAQHSIATLEKTE